MKNTLTIQYLSGNSQEITVYYENELDLEILINALNLMKNISDVRIYDSNLPKFLLDKYQKRFKESIKKLKEKELI